MRNISLKLFQIWTGSSGDVVRYFLPRALSTPFSTKQKHLGSSGRGHHEEHICEIISNLDQWFRRRYHLKTFLIYSSGHPCIKLSQTVCAILVEAIMRNNSVKLF